MLIDISSHAHLILFRVQSFFTIEEPQEVIGSHLIRMQKESATKLFREGMGNFPDLLSYGRNYLDLNGPSKMLSESFLRSLGLSRTCSFSGNDSFGPGLPTAAIAST